jgi:uncharacterized protein
VPGCPNRQNRVVQPIEIPTGDVRLAADFYPAAGDLAFVVTHGWGSERPTDIPAALAGAGYPALAHDLRGFGESTADLAAISRADWVGDVVAVIDRLRELAPGARVALVGASFGGYLSLLAAAERDVVALSLRVPANYPDDGFAEPHQPRWTGDARSEADLQPADSKALRALRAFAGPVQLVIADGDEVIPAQTFEDYAAAVEPSRLTRYTLSGPHHLATPELRGEYIAALLVWADSVALMEA